MKFERLAVCGDCGKTLHNEGTEDLKEIRKRWTLIVMSLPLANMQCPNGCRRTYSDCNANVSVKLRVKGTRKLLGLDEAIKIDGQDKE